MKQNKCVGFFCDSAEINTYKMLRARIQQLASQKGWNTIMITSPNPGEGKTLTTINMSLTFAKEFHQTVLLVDCDLKKQDIHKIMGVPGPKGLADYFFAQTPLHELMIWPDVQRMRFISGGQSVLDTAEILGSLKIKRLVAEMKERYSDRYIFFDVPAILTSADALAFAPFVDGIVMVVQSGKTSTSDIKKSMKLIPNEKFIGFVLNRKKTF
jgi:non-specific protein-tyrosine kinase